MKGYNSEAMNKSESARGRKDKYRNLVRVLSIIDEVEGPTESSNREEKLKQLAEAYDLTQETKKGLEEENPLFLVALFLQARIRVLEITYSDSSEKGCQEKYKEAVDILEELIKKDVKALYVGDLLIDIVTYLSLVRERFEERLGSPSFFDSDSSPLSSSETTASDSAESSQKSGENE